MSTTNEEAAAGTGGRPSKYQPEYAEQARKLCLLGSTDEQVAFFFDVSLAELAVWAMDNKEFLRAITPTEAEVLEHNERGAARKAARQRTRAKHAKRNPSIRLRAATAARVWAALNGRSDGRLFSRLGYSIEDLVEHLESKFQDGMTWENYGKWHVDHKKPCVLFDQSDPIQFTACWALDNLQPLWAQDNIKKGAKYVGS
jgi:hypothetical protein